MGDYFNKLKDFAGGAAKKVDCFISLVKDKTGKEIAVIKDVAGNIIKTVSENAENFFKVALTIGFITVGGLLMSCSDGGSSTSTDIGGPNNPKKPTITLVDVADIEIAAIDVNSTQGEVATAITNGVKGLCEGVVDMRGNIAEIRTLREEGYTEGLPSEAFLHSIDEFHTGLFATGHTAINTVIGTLGDNVDSGDKTLFTANVDALRGMAYIGIKNNTDSNYTDTFSLGKGTVSVGSLLETVNLNNAEGETDYTLSGAYAVDSVKAGAISLLPDAVAKIGKGIITEAVNYEKLFATIQRAGELGMDTTLSLEALNAITAAFGGKTQEVVQEVPPTEPVPEIPGKLEPAPGTIISGRE